MIRNKYETLYDMKLAHDCLCFISVKCQHLVLLTPGDCKCYTSGEIPGATMQLYIHFYGVIRSKYFESQAIFDKNFSTLVKYKKQLCKTILLGKALNPLL